MNLQENTKKLTVKMIAIILAVIFVGAIGGCSSSKDKQDTSTSQSNQTNNSTATSTAETLPTVESLELSSDLISNPNSLSAAEEAFFTKWINSGATEENVVAALESGNTKTYAEQVAAKYDPIFIDALLVDDWENNPKLVALVNKMTTAHIQTLNLYFNTSLPNIYPKDKAPYAVVFESTGVTGFTKNADGTYSYTSSNYVHDNADQNRALELTNGDRVNNVGSGPRTFTVVDNTLKLSDIN